MEKKPVGETYNGPSGGLKKPSDWLTSEDLPLDKDAAVTIEDVLKYTNVKFDEGRIEPIIGALKFVGRDKQMVLNATNRKHLIKMYSADTKQWRGKKVLLYVDQNVKQVGGGVGPGLRIRVAT